MTILRHELRRSRVPFWIWTGAIGFLLAVCIFLFPEMKGEMEDVSEVFSSMGAFTAAFGMDRLNFGTLNGYYAIECGNVLGLGGAFFAALLAAGMLCKEEKERTAEFLLTHPVTRERIVTEKLAAVLLLITVMNLIIYALAVGSILAIGESVPWRELNLQHLAYWLLQMEIAGICFGVSAFLRRGSAVIANITDSAAFLKDLTPFGYCDGAEIVSTGSLDFKRLAIGAVLFAAGIAAAFWNYTRKDIK